MPDIYDCIKSAPSTQNTEKLLSKYSIWVGTVLLKFALTQLVKISSQWKSIWDHGLHRKKLYVAFMCFLLLFIHVLNISIATTTESCSPSKPTDAIADAYVTRCAHLSLWHFLALRRSPFCSQVDWAAPQPSPSPLPQTANWHNNKKIHIRSKLQFKI